MLWPLTGVDSSHRCRLRSPGITTKGAHKGPKLQEWEALFPPIPLTHSHHSSCLFQSDLAIAPTAWASDGISFNSHLLVLAGTDCGHWLVPINNLKGGHNRYPQRAEAVGSVELPLGLLPLFFCYASAPNASPMPWAAHAAHFCCHFPACLVGNCVHRRVPIQAPWVGPNWCTQGAPGAKSL